MSKFGRRKQVFSSDRRKIYRIQWISRILDHLKILGEIFILVNGDRDFDGDTVFLSRKMERNTKVRGINRGWKDMAGRYSEMEICKN